ncbi:MAG: 23S rRNA (adenine(2503)-C(2))-methyltransferase RlmN [Tildeniella nuda ZEHNDER 1965/U140]|jgi:23S rRNA (adenine2503-C2)-methyltransferase|nr:23S rRNA (adenine(2503)-C(2))-methyltransferase RlmN [Tildeniella nuda ZEHNDER 1965/U140]
MSSVSLETSSPLLGKSLAELTEWVQQRGQRAYRGKQLHEWLYQKGVRSLTDISVFPKQWRAELEHVDIGRSTLHQRSAAPDGTVKFLLRLADGQIIETVGIPTFNWDQERGEERGERREEWENQWNEETSLPTTNNRKLTTPLPHPTPYTPHPSLDRLTVCVSSQVGCPMACDFCATGKGGFVRNLTTAEIVDQVLTVQADFQQRVSNVVFMGMGEPLLNTENVVAALRCLNQDVGIGQRTMTVSTVGIPDRIRKLAASQLRATLAVSLHASNQTLREKLIPSARHYPLEALLDECRDYVQITGRRVTFEYILLAGLNDCPEHAIELAKHLRGFQSHVNLIPYNPISEVDYQRPSPQRIQTFVNALKAKHIVVSVRQSRGLAADAACGQLRASATK